jgi:hypothetical protein
MIPARVSASENVLDIKIIYKAGIAGHNIEECRYRSN